MDIETIKSLWNAETKGPLSPVELIELHRAVQHRIGESLRIAACRYHIEITLSVAAALATFATAGFFILRRTADSTLIEELWRWELIALLLAGGVWLYFAWYLNRARGLLRRSGDTFDATLVGDIDRALAQLDFQIGIARGIVWRGFIPVYAALTASLLAVFRLCGGSDHPAAVTVATSLLFAAFLADISAREKAIARRHGPEREELESLRRKLTEAQT
jgi:hypothetical protein